MGLGTIIENIGKKIKGIFSGFKALSSIKDKIKINTKVVLIVAGALGVIIILLLVLAIVSHTGNKTKSTDSRYNPADDPIVRERLPAEDFFLPYEPDFVPDVLLEKEPKDGWDEEDARPFWTDPLEGNERTWRKRIETGIDALLEHVP